MFSESQVLERDGITRRGREETAAGFTCRGFKSIERSLRQQESVRQDGVDTEDCLVEQVIMALTTHRCTR